MPRLLQKSLFQSTSPARGTTCNYYFCYKGADISIHVPRTGDDKRFDVANTDDRNFNPRPPHGGRRLPPIWIPAAWQFQSTSPAWGTTPCRYIVIHRRVYFNPRPLHGGRPTSAVSVNGEYTISIHVPRMGDDLASMSPLTPNTVFQSTSPVRGTTRFDTS